MILMRFFKNSYSKVVIVQQSSKLLKPLTPLTGRRYLKEKEADHVTPISTATQSVSRLHALLDGHRVYPNEDLNGIFRCVLV